MPAATSRCWSTRRPAPPRRSSCDLADVRPGDRRAQRRRPVAAGRARATCSSSGRCAGVRRRDRERRPCRAALRRRRQRPRRRAGDGSDARACASATARAGNVGAEAIGHVVGATRRHRAACAIRCRRSGGIDPQPIAQAQLYAPQAFRRQERAVTRDDYARDGRARAARAARGRDAALDRQLAHDVHHRRPARRRRRRRRLRGRAAPLHRALPAGRPRRRDRRAALRGRSTSRCTSAPSPATSRPTSSGACSTCSAPTRCRRQLGFFHPDRFTLRPAGLPERADRRARWRCRASPTSTPARFQRLGRSRGRRDRRPARIALARLEIARLDNDPNAPENGRLALRRAYGGGLTHEQRRHRRSTPAAAATA